MKWREKSTLKDRRLRQGFVSSTLDMLVEGGIVPVPNHIKIDIDGLEHRVLVGCQRTSTESYCENGLNRDRLSQ